MVDAQGHRCRKCSLLALCLPCGCSLQILSEDVLRCVLEHSSVLEDRKKHLLNLRTVSRHFYKLVNEKLKLELYLGSNEDYIEKLRVVPKDNIVAIFANRLRSIDRKVVEFTKNIILFKNLSCLNFKRIESNHVI